MHFRGNPHVQACDDPDWKPNPEHAVYARSVLELTYFERDLRTAFDDGALEQQEAERGVKRQRVAHLLNTCCDLSNLSHHEILLP